MRKKTIFKVETGKLILAVLFLALTGFLVIYFDEYNDFDSGLGITVFLSLWAIGRGVIFYFVYTFVFTITILNRFYNYHYSGFSKSIIQRIGYDEYCKKSLNTIMSGAFLLSLMTNLVLLLVIHFCWSDISFLPDSSLGFFSSNALVDLLSFLVLAAVGNALYSAFLYFCIPYFKNKFVYQGIILISTFVLIYVAVFLGGFVLLPLGFLLKNNDIPQALACSVIPLSLLAPGSMFEMHGYLDFLCAVIFYGSLATVIFKKGKQKFLENG